MYKKIVVTAALALTALPVTVSAQTTAEKTVMNQVIKAINNGFETLDAGDYAKSYAHFTECTTLIDGNPDIKKQPFGDDGRTFANALDTCRAMTEGGLKLLSWDNVSAQRMRNYLKQLESLSGQACYEMADAILTEAPALSEAYTKGEITVAKRRAECEKEMLADMPVSSVDQEEAQSLAALVPEIAKVRADLTAAQNLPEKTDADILQKYKLLDGLRIRSQDLMSNTALSDTATVRRIPVGNTTAGAIIDDAAQIQKQIAQALAPLKAKSDAAFDRQDAEVKVELPKLLKDDKLSIYKRQGIPSDFSGGPIFSKNGVFSGDGKAVAKDIASATLWYYGDNGKGCTYKYWFNGDTMSKVEKPLGC